VRRNDEGLGWFSGVGDGHSDFCFLRCNCDMYHMKKNISIFFILL
jgi:hypothetical protein